MITNQRQPAPAGTVRYPSEEERVRDERCDAEQSRKFLGVDVEGFNSQILGSAGLTGADGYYAYHDLVAVALDCGLQRSVPELGLRMMMRFADQSTADMLAPTSWSFRLSISEPDATGDETLVVRDPATAHMALIGEGQRAESNDGWLLPQGGVATIEGTLDTRGEAGEIYSPAAAQLYDRILDAFHSDEVRFQWITPTGRDAYMKTWVSGRADCVVIAYMATQTLTNSGLNCRLQRGRVLGLLDAQHVWMEFFDADGKWKRFDPLLQLHCERLWGRGDSRGEFFRGGAPNALPGWSGGASMVVRRTRHGQEDIIPMFSARRRRT